MSVNTKLTNASKSIWAKSVFHGDPNDHRYLLLWQHLQDCAAVARRVWNDFLPDAVKQLQDTASITGGTSLQQKVRALIPRMQGKRNLQ